MCVEMKAGTLIRNDIGIDLKLVLESGSTNSNAAALGEISSLSLLDSTFNVKRVIVVEPPS
jgi:hypothetical protein